MVDVAVSLFTIAFIIALGFFADIFFNKTRIPDVIWLLFFGIFIGSVLKIVNQESLFSIAPLFTAVAIAIILFESGRKMKFKELLKDAPSATLFMFLNLVMSTLLVALGGRFLLGMEFETALLLGVIVAGTSSPMIVTIVDRLGVKNKIKTIMSIESIINSPLVIVVGLVLMESIASPLSILSFRSISSNIVLSFAVSIMVGIIVGVAWAKVLVNLQKYKYHHLMTISILFFVYILSQYLGGSGAMAALVMGITLGNYSSFFKHTKKKVVVFTKETKDFNEIIAFMVRTFFFVFIGAVANLTDFRAIGLGLIITLFLLAARFMVVYPTTLLLKLSRREMLTMGFMIPTGLSAAVLAILPYAQYKIAGTENFVDVVFTIILATTIFATVSMGIVEYTYDRVIKRKRDISH